MSCCGGRPCGGPSAEAAPEGSFESRYPVLVPEPQRWMQCKAGGAAPQFEPGYPRTILDKDRSGDDEYTFTGERLAAVNFPLGGFGAGQVLLQGDGTLQGWLVLSQDDRKNQLGPRPSQNVPACFFGIAAAAKGQKEQAYALTTPLNYTEENCRLPPSREAHVTAHSVQRLQSLPGVRSLTMTGKYPIADVSYDIPGFPAEVTLEAMSPLIPGEARKSAWPAAIFTFNVKNPGTQPVDVRVMESQMNFVGWDGCAAAEPGATTPFWGGNVNTPFAEAAHSGLMMTTLKPKGGMTDGSLCLSGAAQAGVSVKVIGSAAGDTDVWSKFTAGAEVDPKTASPSAPSPDGSSYCGAVVQSATVQPGQSVKMQFVLTWYFPNRLASATGLGDWAKAGKLPEKIGAMYSTWFADAKAVADQFMKQKSQPDELTAVTRVYRDTVYSSSVPSMYTMSAAGRASLIGCPTMFWSQAGVVLGFEGNHCCPLNCSHVYGYTILLERLFPELARDMMYSIFERVWDDSTGCPMRFGRGGWAIDGALASIIKTYLCVQQSDSDLKWLPTVWQHVKKQMQMIMQKFDVDGDGCIRGAQQNTYDTAMYGANTFIGSYYVTALRAASKMAVLMKDDAAKTFADRAKLAAANYEKICWREDFGYYIADVTIKNCQHSYGPGCFVDQLCATALSFACGLGYCFNPDHEKSARQAINKYNVVHMPPFKDMQKHFFPGDSGHTTCSYPNGKLGDGMTYDTLVSIGWVYPVIAGLLHDGLVDDAASMTTMLRQRQDGRNRSPWNEPECNTHYSRMMSGWGLYDQSCGFEYDATSGRIAFAPRFSPTDFNCFFAAQGGWGQYSQKGSSGLAAGSVALAVKYGSVSVSSLAVASSAGSCSAAVDGKAVKVTAAAAGGQLVLTFASPVVVPAGSVLTCTLTTPWSPAPAAALRRRVAEDVDIDDVVKPAGGADTATLNTSRMWMAVLAFLVVFALGGVAGALLRTEVSAHAHTGVSLRTQHHHSKPCGDEESESK